MFSIESKMSLPACCGNRYMGMAYDGCYFYFTLRCAKGVVQFDSCFRKIKCFDTCRAYSSLCYDPDCECFWASDACHPNTLYKLNRCFEEIDCIFIKAPCFCGGTITGISYNCGQNNLMVSFAGGIILVNSECPEESTLFYKNHCGWILGLVCVCPFTFCCCVEDCKEIIRVFSDCGKQIYEFCLPKDIIIQSAVFYPCGEGESSCRFIALAYTHGCCPYILNCELKCCELCKNICDCNFLICGCNLCDTNETPFI